MYKLLNFVVCFFAVSSPNLVSAQSRFTLSGTVKEKESGEVLIGASVYLLESHRSGVVSNAYGFYSISAPAGTYTLVITFSGFKPVSEKVTLSANVSKSIALMPTSSMLEETVVTSSRRNANVVKPSMGVQKLSTSEIASIPVIFGEKDILKTLQLLPGVKSAGEGTAGFYVRGGSADQNLILLDEATVFNASHLLGFFSSFNSDAIKDLTLYKGSMPAEYGGRLSSVLDIKMKDGNNQEYHASGGIGTISSRLNFEGPIVKDKGSFTISGRRTYADLFLKLSSDSSINQNTLYFYDLNLKANYKISSKDRIYVSGYLGKDALAFNNSFGIDYGNTTATVRLNHVFSSRLFSNTSFIYSNYNYNITSNSGSSNIVFKSKIEDISLKQDFQYYAGSESKVNFGFNIIHHRISPGILDASAGSSYNVQDIQSNYAYESALYISHDFVPVTKLNINYGLRVSMFNLMGPGDYSSYDSAGDILKTTGYGSGRVIKTYVNLEPRLSASYQVTENSSVKVAYTRNVQNLHLISNSVSINPTDIWIPTTINVKPGIADQVSLGYFINFSENNYEFSAEVYYKFLQNQIDYKNGAVLLANANIESQLLYGSGRAYGLELFLKKKFGRFTGWVSYTLSRAEKKIPGINDDTYYPDKQDQTHNIALVGIYKVSKKWTLSATWVYNTGSAVTFPSSKYNVNGVTSFYYQDRNANRLPAYHRLDVGATLQGKKHKKWEGSWTFSVYNLYGRQNAYSIQFEEDPGDATKTRAVQTSLFRWVPAVTYNFKF